MGGRRGQLCLLEPKITLSSSLLRCDASRLAPLSAETEESLQDTHLGYLENTEMSEISRPECGEQEEISGGEKVTTLCFVPIYVEADNVP